MKKNKLLQTSSQTVGPFFAYSLTSEQYKYDFPSLITGNMRKKEIEGHPVLITGNVFDGKGETIHDAMIEIWHANPYGKYAISDQEDFLGFGRQGTGATNDHCFSFNTYKPGKISHQDSPHINFTIFARGMLNHLFTRMYFPDEDNQNDFVLNQIDFQDRPKLISQKIDEYKYKFDIFLQGENETIFLDI